MKKKLFLHKAAERKSVDNICFRVTHGDIMNLSKFTVRCLTNW